MFRGIYVGSEYSLNVYLEEIDPHARLFPGVRDYIAAFPFTREYFSRVYPFYNGSKVSDITIYTIYESSFTSFVQMFKLNHPDWSEYSDNECIQHFIDCIEFDADEYHENDDTLYELNKTPPTCEKPHFHVSEIMYLDGGGVSEHYVGSGYFKNVNGEIVPFDRQVGIWGSKGVRRFDIYNRIALLENLNDHNRDEYADLLPPVQLRLYDGTPFDFYIDASEEKNHVRFIENETDDLFLFEESLQNERRLARLQLREWKMKKMKKMKKT